MRNFICLISIWMSLASFTYVDNQIKNVDDDFIFENGEATSLSPILPRNGDEIIIENEQFKLVVGSDAIAKSLLLKSSQRECLMQGENVAIFSVTQERPYHNEIKLAHPNKKTTFQADTLYWNGDKLIVGFELIPYKAIIKVNETPAYVGFTLEGFEVAPGTYPNYLKITPPPATELCLLQLPVPNQKYFGEWLNLKNLI